LFIDDIRDPPEGDWIVVRSSSEGIEHIKANGMPCFISFDHDLGGEDTTMVFLRKLVETVWDGSEKPPEYTVHSANPVGSQNIISFMESWKRSINL
jgi:hypothetical protein